MKQIISTNRIELRFPEQYMANDIFLLISENRLELNIFLPWVKYIYHVNDIEDMISAYQQLFSDNKEYRFYIFENIENKVIGSITLRNIDILSKQAELGFWLDKSHIGNGYITEAFYAISNEAKNIEHIVAKTKVNNYKCIKTLKNLGFKISEESKSYILFTKHL
ncbi:GNAT family N-acetyltransferase [Mammaliicoccus lentus]|uniref:GNAT family N-acetyltransferase n=1 Tax=Mammaliicoccus lentus TaxID=42858 RepID=UPI00264A3671|nr:GNAT family N-acetyltransferase [Mammaliicoccus lentus]